jgi:hypothetical protein
MTALVLVAAGCGSTSHTSSSSSESLISVKRVEAAFRPAPLYLDGIVVLRNLLTPLPYGELGDYSFFKARSLKEFEAQPIHMIPASLTVFPTVQGAQQASLAILHGGDCVAHTDKRVVPAWTQCEHLRVGNVLLITSSDIARRPRQTLIAALRRLGRPTSS